MRAHAGAFAEPIDAYDVQLLPELEGIAEGAAVDAEDILALNVRTEVMFGLDARAAATAVKECTAICALPAVTTDGHVLHAQNWDWKRPALESCVLLVCAPHDRSAFITLVEAGLLAKCGMNAAGLSLTANALTSSLDRGHPGVPFHAILRRILTSATLEEAIDAVTRPRRASSADHLIASRDGRSADIEVAPGGPENVHMIEGPTLVHTNHFLWAERPFKDLGRLGGTESLDRRRRAEAAIAERPLDLDAIKAGLRDHEHRPNSVCSHPDPSVDPVADYVTIASVVMDLTQAQIHLTRGNPCEAPYEVIDVGALLRAPHDP